MRWTRGRQSANDGIAYARGYAADGLRRGVPCVPSTTGDLDPLTTARALRAAPLPIRRRDVRRPRLVGGVIVWDAPARDDAGHYVMEPATAPRSPAPKPIRGAGVARPGVTSTSRMLS